MNTSMATVTEYRLDGSIVRYKLTREELALYRCPEVGCRVAIMWIKEPADD